MGGGSLQSTVVRCQPLQYGLFSSPRFRRRQVHPSSSSAAIPRGSSPLLRYRVGGPSRPPLCERAPDLPSSRASDLRLGWRDAWRRDASSLELLHAFMLGPSFCARVSQRVCRCHGQDFDRAVVSCAGACWVALRSAGLVDTGFAVSFAVFRHRGGARFGRRRCKARPTCRRGRRRCQRRCPDPAVFTAFSSRVRGSALPLALAARIPYSRVDVPPRSGYSRAGRAPVLGTWPSTVSARTRTLPLPFSPPHEGVGGCDYHGACVRQVTLPVEGAFDREIRPPGHLRPSTGLPTLFRANLSTGRALRQSFRCRRRRRLLGRCPRGALGVGTRRIRFCRRRRCEEDLLVLALPDFRVDVLYPFPAPF